MYHNYLLCVWGLIGILLFSPIGISYSQEQVIWVLETVDSGEIVCRNTSLALDSAGRPHISYYDGANDDLKYAYYEYSSWQIQTIDEGDVGGSLSLALDEFDQPHVSYYDGTNGDLKYAYYENAGWRIQTVDSEGDVGWYNSLALDSSGQPHISYYDEDNDYLKYAYYDDADLGSGQGWQIEIVDLTGGSYSSIRLDAAGCPHISYNSLSLFSTLLCSLATLPTK